MCEPLYVTAPYLEGNEERPMMMNNPRGQEFDYILEGSLRMEVCLLYTSRCV